MNEWYGMYRMDGDIGYSTVGNVAHSGGKPMTTEVRKVTISLPAHLVDFADQLAVRVRTSRSQVISQALVAITSRVPPQAYPFIVVVEPEKSGLLVRSAINCAQMATIQQGGETSRLRPPRGEADVRAIGQLSPARMAEVDRAIRFNLALG
jgi:mRNA-degrading endonuclease toxin of MazEF toxin-antitoxin module